VDIKRSLCRLNCGQWQHRYASETVIPRPAAWMRMCQHSNCGPGDLLLFFGRDKEQRIPRAAIAGFLASSTVWRRREG